MGESIGQAGIREAKGKVSTRQSLTAHQLAETVRNGSLAAAENALDELERLAGEAERLRRELARSNEALDHASRGLLKLRRERDEARHANSQMFVDAELVARDLRAERDRLKLEKESLRTEVHFIAQVATSWHGDDAAKARALKVISDTADRALAASGESDG